MPLTAGTRLGPYELIALLGTGGMGEVCRARDTRLDRTVAIKVLPAALAADPERRARFEREARAISRLSPDRRRVAVETIQTEKRIWVHDLRVPGSLDPITEPDMAAAHPVWLDSQRLAFSGYADGRPSILFGRADKSEPPEYVVSSAFQAYPASWTRDGQLLYVAESPTTNMDIWTLSAGGGSRNGTEWLATEAVEKMAQISPDGQWSAYATNESGATEVHVRRYPGRADRQKLTTGGGDQPVWSRNGRELFYLRGSSDNRELVVHDVGAGGAVAPTGRVLFRLAPLRLTGYDPVPGFDVTSDGQRFAFPRHPDTSPPPLTDRIHIVQNWFEELKEKAPRQQTVASRALQHLPPRRGQDAGSPHSPEAPAHSL